MKTWKPIEKIIYDLTIWDDGVRSAQTPLDQSRRIIAETLLRLPESIREKVLEEAIFFTIGGAYGCVLQEILSELKSEDQLIKTSEGLVRVEIEVQLILINFRKWRKMNWMKRK